MAAPKKNQFWKLRSKHGKDRIFKTPEDLWKATCEYFEHCDANPLKEEKLFHYQGTVISHESNKLRAYTLTGLCLYLGCDESYFRSFKSIAKKENKENKEKDYLTVITRIEKTIYDQKFTGAAADLLNPNIIARDLGLKDSKDISVVDKTSFYLPEEDEDNG